MCTTDLSRRHFIRLGTLSGLGTLFVPVLAHSAVHRAARKLLAGDNDPHFFLQIVVAGGLDPSYLFDARPLSMTQAGKIANYSGQEPARWEGANGVSTWATSMTDPLKPVRDRFTILNGVLMATGADGHNQNMNYLFTGDIFGGESFIPHLNHRARSSEKPLDAIQKGSVYADLTNSGGTIPLGPEEAATLVDKLGRSAPLAETNPLFRFMAGRMDALSTGTGQFSAGAAAMAKGLRQTPELYSLLKQLKFDPPAPPPQGTQPAPGGQTDPAEDEKRFMGLVLQLFGLGVTPSAILRIDPGTFNVDTHDPMSAKALPKLAGSMASRVAMILALLRDTPFDAARSYLDVTTVMFASEFARTMRQKNFPIDGTGTDHNPLNNSILIGGAGVRGGLVIGASDLATETEAPSKAHLSLDSDQLKAMGRPFDFATMKPRADLPETYAAEDYLNFASVANTIYELFGVTRDRYRPLKRNGGPAPVLPGLLA